MGFKTIWERENGLPRELKTYLDSNTKLAQKTVSEMGKSEFKTIKHIVIGALIAFILGISKELLVSNNVESETKLLQKQLIELNKTMSDFHTDFHKLSLELISLRKDKDSLKNGK